MPACKEVEVGPAELAARGLLVWRPRARLWRWLAFWQRHLFQLGRQRVSRRLGYKPPPVQVGSWGVVAKLEGQREPCVPRHAQLRQKRLEARVAAL